MYPYLSYRDRLFDPHQNIAILTMNIKDEPRMVKKDDIIYKNMEEKKGKAT